MCAMLESERGTIISCTVGCWRQEGGPAVAAQQEGCCMCGVLASER